MNNAMDPIPQNLDQCKQRDNVSSGLLEWANTVISIGQAIMAIVLIFGIFSIIEVLPLLEEIFEGELEYFVAFLTPVISCILSAVGVFFVYQATALLLRALASIVYNSHVSANVALYSANGGVSAAPVAQPAAQPVVQPAAQPVAQPAPQQVSRTVTTQQVPVAPVFAAKPEKTADKTLKEILRYANQFSTVQGMRSYLTPISRNHTSEYVRKELEEILKVSDDQLPDIIGQKV